MKKWLVAATGLVLALTLAGCSKTVASTSGGKITQKDYYNEMKKTDQGKQVLQQMIIQRVMEDQYGKKVTKKDVNKRADDFKKQYEEAQKAAKKESKNAAKQSYEEYLQSYYGVQNESLLKKQLRSSMLFEAAVKANTDTSDKALEAAWKDWEPKITVSHILVKNEDDAKKIIQQLDDGADFAKLAKEKSEDPGSKADGGKLPAFNKNGQYYQEFMDAAFKLKKVGDYTAEPVKTEAGYHVIKLDAKQAKSDKKDKAKDIKKYKKEMTEDMIAANQNDQAFVAQMIGKMLKKGNVSIKDDDLKNILQQYMSADSGVTTPTTK